MGHPKPLASLSSTLLARKGTARPAMRPQGFGGFGTLPGAQDDLGWNDMGEPEAAPVAEAPMPPVLVQRDVLREELAASPLPVARPSRPVSVATAARIGRETQARHAPLKNGKEARSAFTLRLDADRHLKLRLASALQNRSAQQLVTQALDAFLETLPDVGTLVSQLPARATKQR